jgi:hypothetical protein
MTVTDEDLDDVLEVMGFVRAGPRAASEPDTTTWIQLAKEEALKAGVIIEDEAADFILWERTAFPFIGPDELRRAIAIEIETHWKNYKPKTVESPTAWAKLDKDE